MANHQVQIASETETLSVIYFQLNEDVMEQRQSFVNSFLSNPSAFNFNMPIYEELLINLSRSPERLARLSTLVEKLSDPGVTAIVPADFTTIWKTIKEMLPR